MTSRSSPPSGDGDSRGSTSTLTIADNDRVRKGPLFEGLPKG
jgi:hypothetical protein